MNKQVGLLVAACMLSGCSSEGFDDLAAWMAQVKAAPAGRLDPIPTFTPYKPFDYSATTLRAPFDLPVLVKPEELEGSKVVEAPSTTRAKELLEQFSIEALKMVGTLEKDGQLWALLNDGQGNVHYVKNGNYVGKNNGKIVATTVSYVQVVEVISDGGNGWVERPRVLELREQ